MRTSISFLTNLFHLEFLFWSVNGIDGRVIAQVVTMKVVPGTDRHCLKKRVASFYSRSRDPCPSFLQFDPQCSTLQCEVDNIVRYFCHFFCGIFYLSDLSHPVIGPTLFSFSIFDLFYHSSIYHASFLEVIQLPSHRHIFPCGMIPLLKENSPFVVSRWDIVDWAEPPWLFSTQPSAWGSADTSGWSKPQPE